MQRLWFCFIRDSAHGFKSATILDGPYQRKCDFKKKLVQGRCRSFEDSWYMKFPWLEYRIIKGATFCYFCRLFCQHTLGHDKEAFTIARHFSRKKVLEKFRENKKSKMLLKLTQVLSENQSHGKLSLASSHLLTQNKSRNADIIQCLY